MTPKIHGRALPWMALATAATLLGAVACNDTNVPFLTAPAGTASNPAGFQNDVTGLFEGPRGDMSFGISGFMDVVTGFARDGAVFTNTESRTVEYPLGVFPFPASSGSVWTQEYLNIAQAQEALVALPKVSGPAYTAPQQAAITGVIQTLQAYYYMLIAETHDTAGIAILPAGLTAQQQAPTYCSKDGWKYIVALLDSANTALTTAGGIPLSVQVPTGFAGVGSVAGPASAAGSFASFNRALAAKANLELAYAIARYPSGTSAAPSPTSAGSPDVASLTTALADLTGSALYAPGQLAPEVPGPFAAGAYDITLDFSGVSGDVVDPVNAALGTTAVLNDFVADVDTAGDLRWKAHYISNPNSVQEKFYSPVASTFIPDMFSTTSAPIPIMREVDLVLWHAQIEMGLGAANYAAALADINLVRTTMGGLPAYPAGDASSYVTLRDDLMREQRISTAWETSANRTISIRMYGMATVSDTTWEHEDPNVTTGDNHTTIEPIPFSELSGRGNSSTFVITQACQ